MGGCGGRPELCLGIWLCSTRLRIKIAGECRFRRRFEIRRNPVSRQNLARRPAPNDPASAEAMLGAGLSVAVAPDLIGDGPDFVVAARIILQSGGLRAVWARPPSRRARTKIADLPDRLNRHRPGRERAIRTGKARRRSSWTSPAEGEVQFLQDQEPVAQTVRAGRSARRRRTSGSAGLPCWRNRNHSRGRDAGSSALGGAMTGGRSPRS